MIKKILQSNKGETLVEALAGILIISLATLVLLGSVVASTGLNKQAQTSDSTFKSEVWSAEGNETKLGSGTFSIRESGTTVINYSVDYYGKVGGELRSFTKAGG